MKISSNFHDYYDVMRSGDLDPEPLYVRLTKDIESEDRYLLKQKLSIGYEENEKMAWKLRHYIPQIENISYQSSFYVERVRYNYPTWLNPGVIGFCGKAFPFFSVGSIDSPKTLKFAFSPQKTIKLISEYNEGMRDNNLERLKKEILKNIIGEAHSKHWDGDRRFLFQDWEKFLINNNIGDEIFRHFKSPVLLVGKQKNILITINPRLNQYGFNQVMTPPDVFQELSMFVGNNLANLDRKEPRPISDELRAETKGFNKQSFRNQKNRKVSDRKDW